MHLGKKESREENLEPSVVLALTKCLEATSCTIFFDNFCNSLSLIIQLFDNGICRTGTARMDGKGMPKMLTVNGLINDQSQCCSVTFLACNQLQLVNGE